MGVMERHRHSLAVGTTRDPQLYSLHFLLYEGKGIGSGKQKNFRQWKGRRGGFQENGLNRWAAGPLGR